MQQKLSLMFTFSLISDSKTMPSFYLACNFCCGTFGNVWHIVLYYRIQSSALLKKSHTISKTETTCRAKRVGHTFWSNNRRQMSAYWLHDLVIILHFWLWNINSLCKSESKPISPNKLKIYEHNQFNVILDNREKKTRALTIMLQFWKQ